MTAGNAFFFVAGALAIVAALFIAYPWLAGRPRADLFGALPRWVPIALIVGIAGVLALYLKLGSPQLTDRDASPAADSAPTGVAAGSMPVGRGGEGVAQKRPAAAMDSAVSGLERRLAAGGGSDGDWELLAKSYEFLGRPEDAAAARLKRLPAGAGSVVAPAVAAAAPKLSDAAMKLLADANAARTKRDFAAARALYVKLAARNEMTADAWADYADVIASLNGNSLAGQPAVLIANALRLDPQHPKALWLQASMEHETRRYADAVRSWQKLATVLGPDSGDARLIAANLAEDQRLAAGNGPAAAVAVQAAQGMVVRGEVVLADALRGKVPAGLTLFIVAKSVHSPGPPVAILRTTTGSWPLQFQLDDSQAMLPERKLSTAGTVTVEARTSKTGQAMPVPGDFQGVTAQFDPAAGKPVRVVIQRVIG
jgi:cytochrome c-type biogenesis protein CcmH/NrfG